MNLELFTSITMPGRLLRSRYFISEQAQHDFDYLYEKTGFRAHRVNPETKFSHLLNLYDDLEAAKLELIIRKFAKLGFIFTNNEGVLLGNVSTVSTRSDRVSLRRASFKLVK